MEWINSILFEHSAIQAIVVLSLVTATGLWLGKIHICGISLGVTFVFFMGILAGHLGISLDADMLNYAESFGLVMFVYALGLQVGPGFFSSFRHGGIPLNMLSLGVIFGGTALTLLLSYLLSIPLPEMVGVLCGATTNTPALGAAQQTLKQMGEPSSGAALGAAVAYPLGVVGVILAILVIRKLLAHPDDLKEKNTETENAPYVAAFQVHNPGVFHKTLKELGVHSHLKFVVSRLWRDGKVTIPTSTTELLENDRILVITTEKEMPTLTLLFGEQENRDWNQEDIDWNSIDRNLVSEHIVVTRSEINGKRLGSLHLRNAYDINISRVLRSGVQILATAVGRPSDRHRRERSHQACRRAVGQLGFHPARAQSGRHLHRHRIGISAGICASQFSGHQQSRENGAGRRTHHRRYSGGMFRSAPAHAHLYHTQCQPHAPGHRSFTLPGRYRHRRGGALL